MSAGREAILFDRDGTIIVDRGYLKDPAAIEFECEAVEGIALLAAAGLSLVVVSNQSGIGRGYFDEAVADAVNARLASLLGSFGICIDGWYICPHTPQSGCDCRKPAPGLAHRAAHELGLDLKRSWVVGDKRSDLELADAIGAKGVLVTTGEGEKSRGWALAGNRPVCRSLLQAATLILDRDAEAVRRRAAPSSVSRS
jgi:histidinol-phosphate phosphatase family protein